MCGRFTQMFTWHELVSLYRIHDKAFANLRANYNAAPTQDLGVILPGSDGLTYRTMRWGLVPAWAEDMKIGVQCINARLESAAEKPAFRSAWKSRRCVVPANGYFEWTTIEVPGQRKPLKQPFYVSRKDDLPWSFAGLWERWGEDGLLTFTILTMEASPAIRRLHDRQPVILDDAAVSAWLDTGNIGLPNDLVAKVQIWPVTPRMNNSRYEEADSIVPIGESI
jgi:putative SOS response-associated peptidase YedK